MSKPFRMFNKENSQYLKGKNIIFREQQTEKFFVDTGTEIKSGEPGDFIIYDSERDIIDLIPATV